MRNLIQFSQVGFVSSHCSFAQHSICTLRACQLSRETGFKKNKNKRKPTLIRLSLQFLQPCRDLKGGRSARQVPKRAFHAEEKTPRAIPCLTTETRIWDERYDTGWLGNSLVLWQKRTLNNVLPVLKNHRSQGAEAAYLWCVRLVRLPTPTFLQAVVLSSDMIVWVLEPLFGH